MARNSRSKFTVVSTFSGCGGSSLGYKLAGGDVRLAVEWDDNAVETYKLNFPSGKVYHGDIAALKEDECLDLAELQPGELDILDGSPPCQGFSLAGKRRIKDQRNSLFLEFSRLLKALKPRTFIMENVAAMSFGKMRNVLAAILKELSNCGYEVEARILNAAYYGVPQRRARAIFIGVRTDLDSRPSFPEHSGKAIVFARAVEGIKDHDQTSPPLSNRAIRQWFRIPEGGQGEANFNQRKLARFKVAPTLISATGSAPFHPTEVRRITCGEARRIASFPDDFKFAGGWNNAIQRIGNSVPPNLMKAIAKNLYDQVLSKVA